MIVIASRGNGKEIHKAYTDSVGNFDFPKLRPGRWKLSIQSQLLPDLTQSDQEEIEFDLQPGEQQSCTFNIYPVERQILPFD